MADSTVLDTLAVDTDTRTLVKPSLLNKSTKDAWTRLTTLESCKKAKGNATEIDMKMDVTPRGELLQYMLSNLESMRFTSLAYWLAVNSWLGWS